MYWPNHWESSARFSNPAEEKGVELLDAVLEKSEQKPRPLRKGINYAVFPSEATESRFKNCLSRVPLECRTEHEGKKTILAVRPKNLTYFDQVVQNSGLADCETAMRAIHFLRDNPTGFLRFESH